MNRAYRSIWNQALGTWVAVSELASARGKPGKAKLLGAVTLAAVPTVSSDCVRDVGGRASLAE